MISTFDLFVNARIASRNSMQQRRREELPQNDRWLEGE
jgi:hypothetical protein